MVEVKYVHRLPRGCGPFILPHQVEKVYYMLYPCKKLNAWWVVYRVNPRELLHTPGDSGYHENQVAVGDVSEVYQDDKLLCSFNKDPDSALNSLLGDANDVTDKALRKKKHKILNVLYISYYVLYISYYILALSYYVLYISYYVFDEYSLVLGLNRMSKKLKSVTKNLFGGKSRARTVDTLFQGCSTTTSRRVEIMRHMNPALVG
jgi:hypothetical protein